jgi:hypothetical protein
MKTLRIVLIVLGILFIIFNLVGITAPITIPENENLANKIGYYVGRSVFFILAIIFFVLARWLGKRLEKRKAKNMVDTLLQ